MTAAATERPAIAYARLLRTPSDFIRRGQRETDEAEDVRLRGHAADLNDLIDGTARAARMSTQQEAA